MRGVVAIILALAVVILLAPGALVPLLTGSRTPTTPDELQLWRDILLVLLGALATYLGGKPNA